MSEAIRQLVSTGIAHPAIEALFTIDEVGAACTGAEPLPFSYFYF